MSNSRRVTIYTKRLTNAGTIAQNASEHLVDSSRHNRDSHRNKNFLAVFNRSGETLDVFLDNRQQTGDLEAKVFQVSPGQTPAVLVEPEDDTWFSNVGIKNLDAGTTQIGEITVDMAVRIEPIYLDARHHIIHSKLIGRRM